MASKLLETLLADIKATMKAKDSEKLTALRTLHSDIKNFGINNRKEITDDDVVAVLAKAVKQRKESLEQYTKAGRDDLAQKEQFEIDIFSAYQPEQLDEAAITELVEKAIAEAKATAKKDMGAVMKILMPQVKGRADGKLVSAIVNSKLS